MLGLRVGVRLVGANLMSDAMARAVFDFIKCLETAEYVISVFAGSGPGARVRTRGTSWSGGELNQGEGNCCS